MSFCGMMTKPGRFGHPHLPLSCAQRIGYFRARKDKAYVSLWNIGQR